MRKRLSLILGLFGLFGTAWAQSPLIRTDLIPSSPTAGSIARAGEVPMNLSSGLPSLSIPICTVQGNELSLPISLSYSYDGFKPAQPSGWVGMGWSLEAGGVITRSVRDKVDGTMGAGDYNGTTVQTTLYSPADPSQAFLAAAPGTYDLEPDEFSFNFAGYSGKFIIHNDKFYVYPSQKLRVTGSLGGFTITTEDGNKYTFDAVETTNPKGSPGAPYNLPSSYVSAYYLTLVENAAGTERIVLNYTTEGKLSNNGSATQTWRRDMGLTFDYTTPPSPSLSYPTYVNPLRLTSIVSEKQSVSFIPGPSRLDVNQSAGGSAKELAQIDISGKTGLIKRFKLGHSYAGNSTQKYLMLDFVKDCPRPLEIGESGPLPDTLVHGFEYEGIAGVSRTMAFVDHFGFSTGNSEFSTMMMPNFIHPSGVNREPNITGTSQGALKKVTYPSGGSSSFNYELNMTAEGAGPIRNELSVSDELHRPSGGTSTVGSLRKSFTLAQGQNIVVVFSRTPYTEQGDGIARNVDNDFEVSNSTGVVLSGKIDYEIDNAGKTVSGYLAAGSYDLVLKADWREAYVSATLGYYVEGTAVTEGTPSGGLRVASMTTTGLTGPALYREFRYTAPTGYSSGVAPSRAYNQAPFQEITYNASAGAFDYKNYMVYSSYVAEAPSTSLPHYYTSVLEKQFSGTDTIVTRHDFRAFDYPGMGTAPSRVTQYRRNGSGALIPASSKSYEYVQVQDTMFRKMRAFQTMQVNNSGGMWSGPTEQHDYTSEFITLGWKYLKGTKDVTYEGSDSLVTVTNNSYDASRNLALSTTTGSRGEVTVSRMKYPESYDGDLAFMTTKGITAPVVEQQVWNRVGTDSVLVSGTITEYSATLFRPVKQYLLTTPGISALNNESRTGSLYNNLMSDTRYEERVAYGYDANGRLISQQLTGGTPTSYQWGHPSIMPYGYSSTGQMNHPIAEARNALPAEFHLEDFEEHTGATTGTANTGDKYYSGDFYLNWSIPNGRSYVVSFFYRSGGKWAYKRQAYTGAVTLADGDAIDDVAVYPADAQLSSMAYLDGIGTRSVIDAKGMKASYEYDKFNRLLNIRDQDGNIVKNYAYNQGTANGFYYNVARSGSYVRNNCGPGLFGSMVTYTVPANTYSSTTSQAAADALADANIASNGQAYANANGTCGTGVAVSFVNDSLEPFEGVITQLQVKDSGGNVLYTFNDGQVNAGFNIPQGTYTLSFTLIVPSGGPGWEVCSVTSASGYNEFHNTGAGTYNVTGVVMTSSTALIYLSSF